MKLRFDENLSPRLPVLLARECPDSVHVRAVGLERASEDPIGDLLRRRYGDILAYEREAKTAFLVVEGPRRDLDD